MEDKARKQEILTNMIKGQPVKRHEVYITPDELRKFLKIPSEAVPGDIHGNFVLPAGQWLFTWKDYSKLKY